MRMSDWSSDVCSADLVDEIDGDVDGVELAQAVAVVHVAADEPVHQIGAVRDRLARLGDKLARMGLAHLADAGLQRREIAVRQLLAATVAEEIGEDHGWTKPGRPIGFIPSSMEDPSRLPFV